MQNVKAKVMDVGPRVGLACMLCAASCMILLSACLATPAYQIPAQAQGATPANGQEVTLAGGEGTDVLAEGTASDGDSGIARNNALNDALRKAVEQGVGAFVDSDTRVENYQLISDEIHSEAPGYVSSYRVITAGRDAGLYRVTIRARVKLDKIANDLAATGVLLEGQGRPRVIVVVKEIPKDDIIAVTDRMLEPETMETLISGAFQSRGFPVVDAATVRQNLAKDQLRRILEGDDAAAVEVGLRTDAEIVVAGTVQEWGERRAAPDAGPVTDFFKIRLSARAVNTATARVLGTTLLAIESPLSEDSAREQAADSAGAELVARILEGWKSRANITEIYAENADYQRVHLLKSTIMRDVRGVDSVMTRAFVARSAVIEVFSEVTPQEVLVQINRRITAIPFAVKGLSGNRIDIRFEDTPEQGEPEFR